MFDGFESWGSFADKPFWQRDGPAKGGSERSSYKICLVATDLPYLAAVLRGIADREDCFAVKFSEGDRDGMHLGRAVLTTDQATAELTAILKRDPKLMAALQDDAFFEQFRSSA